MLWSVPLTPTYVPCLPNQSVETDVLQVLQSEHDLSWMIVLVFGIYLICVMILMVNLLIAQLGDTFDRVRDGEEGLLLMGLAEFIDSREATLSEKQKAQME